MVDIDQLTFKGLIQKHLANKGYLEYEDFIAKSFSAIASMVCRSSKEHAIRVLLGPEGLVVTAPISEFQNEKEAFNYISAIKAFFDALKCDYYDIAYRDKTFEIILGYRSLGRVFYFIYMSIRVETKIKYSDALADFADTKKINLPPQQDISDLQDNSRLSIVLNQSEADKHFEILKPKKNNLQLNSVIVCDITGSMEKPLTAAKTLISQLIDRLPGLVRASHSDRKVNYTFAGVAYRDYSEEVKKEELLSDKNKVCFSENFSTNPSSIDNFFKPFEATGGGDTAEAMELALYRARFLAWPEKLPQTSTIKSVFLLFDAVAHAAGDSSDNYKTPYSNPSGLHYEVEVNNLAQMGVKIYPIICAKEPSNLLKNFAKEIADKTGGTVLNLSDNFDKLADILVKSLLAGIEETTFLEEATRSLMRRGVAVDAASLSGELSHIFKPSFSSKGASTFVTTGDSMMAARHFLTNSDTSIVVSSKEREFHSAATEGSAFIVGMAKGSGAEYAAPMKNFPPPDTVIMSRHETSAARIEGSNRKGPVSHVMRFGDASEQPKVEKLTPTASESQSAVLFSSPPVVPKDKINFLTSELNEGKSDVSSKKLAEIHVSSTTRPLEGIKFPSSGASVVISSTASSSGVGDNAQKNAVPHVITFGSASEQPKVEKLTPIVSDGKSAMLFSSLPVVPKDKINFLTSELNEGKSDVSSKKLAEIHVSSTTRPLEGIKFPSSGASVVISSTASSSGVGDNAQKNTVPHVITFGSVSEQSKVEKSTVSESQSAMFFSPPVVPKINIVKSAGDAKLIAVSNEKVSDVDASRPQPAPATIKFCYGGTSSSTPVATAPERKPDETVPTSTASIKFVKN